MNDLDIYVATHKKVENCINLDGCYKYLFVGANNHTDTYGYICDNDGSDSISEKNSTYCELTGLYWMWKNAPKQKYILPAGVGKVASAQNIASYFITIAALGLPSYGVREFAKIRENRDQRNKLFTVSVIE